MCITAVVLREVALAWSAVAVAAAALTTNILWHSICSTTNSCRWHVQVVELTRLSRAPLRSTSLRSEPAATKHSATPNPILHILSHPYMSIVQQYSIV
jgi:hypothetical protein